MKIDNREEFDRQNVFGLGQENSAFAQYFIGNSYLNPLTDPKECAVFLANVTFERDAATTGIFIMRREAAVSF